MLELEFVPVTEIGHRKIVGVGLGVKVQDPRIDLKTKQPQFLFLEESGDFRDRNLVLLHVE